jgi:predicted Zn finger-like uncharacterized protein
VIITCPSCQTRYRVDAIALTKPGGRTLRCAACGLSWRYPPAPLKTGPRETAKADPLPLEPTLAAPTRPEPLMRVAAPSGEPPLAAPTQPEPPDPTPGTPTPAGERPWASLLAADGTGAGGPPQPRPVEEAPRRRRWLTVGLPMLVVLIVVLAALYLARP